MTGRRRDERGSAVVEVVWLSLLLMVPLVYVMLAVFDVQRGAFGVSSASRAAGRAYALADSDVEGHRRAAAAARLALEDQRVPTDGMEVEVTCRPEPGHCLSPGSDITVVVRTRVALPLAPPVLGGEAPSFRVESVHRVPYGRYVERR